MVTALHHVHLILGIHRLMELVSLLEMGIINTHTFGVLCHIMFLRLPPINRNLLVITMTTK